MTREELADIRKLRQLRADAPSPLIRMKWQQAISAIHRAAKARQVAR